MKHISMGGWSPYGPAMQAHHNEGTPYCGVKENKAIKIEKGPLIGVDGSPQLMRGMRCGQAGAAKAERAAALTQPAPPLLPSEHPAPCLSAA